METSKDLCHCQTNITCEEICKCDCKGNIVLLLKQVQKN